MKRKFFRTKTLVIGLIFALTTTIDGVRRNTAQPLGLHDYELRFVRKLFRTKTLVIGLIFALTSTTDGIRRNTAQPFRLQDKNFVL